MNWFKETWWIVKQLFTKVKADKVEYKHMDHYPFSGYSAMSWCGYLLSRKPESQIKPTTWNHENIHLYEVIIGPMCGNGLKVIQLSTLHLVLTIPFLMRWKLTLMTITLTI